MIGRYEIIKKIGEGGMGEVFLAYDPVNQRQVALKQIRLKNLQVPINDRQKAQFLNEARLTAQLVHPSIIPIYSVYEEESAIYYTMPFLEGKRLDELFTEARTQENENTSITAFLPLFLKICQAVAYAHSKKFIHRDLKPSNIMIGHFGEVVLFDWGLISLSSNSQKIEGTQELRFCSIKLNKKDYSSPMM